MEELRSMSGAEFDQAYMKYQIQIHEQAIDLVQAKADFVHDSHLHHHLKGDRQDLLTHISRAYGIERHMRSHRMFSRGLSATETLRLNSDVRRANDANPLKEERLVRTPPFHDSYCDGIHDDWHAAT